MSERVEKSEQPLWERHRWSLVLLGVCIAAWMVWPAQATSTLSFVVTSMIDVSTLVIPGILLSAWVNVSGIGGSIRQAFSGNPLKALVVAAMVGAVTPVCGITVLPLMASLLASGVPLAPVMAFWLSSPVTDPAMFTVTAATLGWHFAIGKTLAALAIGVLGGVVTIALSARPWIQAPLRQRGLATIVGFQPCSSTLSIKLAFWVDADRRQLFMHESWSITKLIIVCLGLAFAAEFLMQQFMRPEALAHYVGAQSGWAIPLAVFIGSPAYLDGYAALPLTRGLIDHGMSLGAAMAFLVSGSVVSIWGAIAIFPVLRMKPFLLYLVLAVTGSLMVGWLYEVVT